MPTIEELANTLTIARAEYYAGRDSGLTDDEYDALERKLKKLDPEHPLLKTVGAPAENTLRKVKHAARMGSLDNAFSPESIEDWVMRAKAASEESGISCKTVVASPKMDGLSIEIQYVDGVLSVASTRGDGDVGEDVTSNVLRAKGVPHTIKYPITMSVRGEMMITNADFTEHFAGEANPRSSAAGTVRSKDGVMAKYLTFYAFEVTRLPKSDIPEISEARKTVINSHVLLSNLGFNVVKSHLIVLEAQEIIGYWEDLLARRPNLGFGIDGLVICLNRRKLHDVMGWADTCPRYALACKWRGELQADATITGIENSVGRTGVITPVAIFQPVSCGGVTVNKASLMNWDEVHRLTTASSGKKIGVGAKVKLERAGDVIPRVVSVIEGADNAFERPERCPSCDGPCALDGPRQVCRNPKCPAQSVRSILHWIKNRNIMHLGPETVDKLMAIGGPVSDICDLYLIQPGDYARACGSQVLARKIVEELDKSKDCDVWDVLGSIGIPKVGITEARKLCEAAGVYSLKAAKLVTLEAATEAIGPVKGGNFVKGVAKRKALITALDSHLRVRGKSENKAATPWSGKTFCITGDTELPRGALVQSITAAGGIYKSSVVKGLDFLIIADPKSTSTKARAAREAGVTLISESKALGMAGFG